MKKRKHQLLNFMFIIISRIPEAFRASFYSWSIRFTLYSKNHTHLEAAHRNINVENHNIFYDWLAHYHKLLWIYCTFCLLSNSSFFSFLFKSSVPLTQIFRWLQTCSLQLLHKYSKVLSFAKEKKCFRWNETIPLWVMFKFGIRVFAVVVLVTTCLPRTKILN